MLKSVEFLTFDIFFAIVSLLFQNWFYIAYTYIPRRGFQKVFLVLFTLIILISYFITGTPGPMALDDFEKIVGGVEATPHQFPWQVGLFFDGYFCGRLWN